MGWIVLVISAVFEAIWATALGRSEGFTQPVPTVVFFVGVVISMIGLGYAMRSIPISTAYAVWVGIGAALTVGFAMITGEETASALKIVFLLGIIGCVIGLKLVGTPNAAAEAVDELVDTSKTPGDAGRRE